MTDAIHLSLLMAMRDRDEHDGGLAVRTDAPSRPTWFATAPFAHALLPRIQRLRSVTACFRVRRLFVQRAG